MPVHAPSDAAPSVDGCERVLRCVLTTADNGSSLQGEALGRATALLRGLGEDVGAVLLVGTGPNFCTGGDVQGFAQADDVGRHVRDIAERFHDFQRAVLLRGRPAVGQRPGAGRQAEYPAGSRWPGLANRAAPGTRPHAPAARPGWPPR